MVKNWCWNYYDGDVKRAKCKYCPQSYVGGYVDMNFGLQSLRETFGHHSHLTNVMKEIHKWMIYEGDYAVNKFGDRSEAWYHLDTEESVDSYKWWSLHFPDKPLSTLAAMLKSIPITSASCERVWSIRSNVHCKTRNRYYYNYIFEII
jgi:hypothetical protein